MNNPAELIFNPPRNPFEFFRQWFQDAQVASVPMPEAVCLSTMGLDGGPTARFVLLRGYDDRGFRFFTNYESQKGRELQACPRAALTFHWVAQERQIRLRGSVELTTTEESDAYWQSRPRNHRLGALSSEQSRPLENSATLGLREKALSIQFPGENIPRPPHWGGFRLLPLEIEFWQGRPHRLHDRLRYVRATLGGPWRTERLQP